MRLAQVIAGAPMGGAELFFERLTIALSATDEVLPVIRRDAARAARLRAAGLTPLELAFGGPFDLFTSLRLRAALRRYAPAVVVAWMSRAARFSPRGDWVLVGRLGGYYDLRRFRHCDHLAGNTRGIVAWITTQGWPAGRVHYLPNFVPDMAGATPAELGLPPNVQVLLGLGRLHRNKGFDVLIRALPRLPQAHAVIAGAGPELSALQALAQAERVADRVHLLGWRSDIAALLARADVFVCPSRHEPLGNVIIEAWSAGRPVIAAAAQGPSELITHGRDGSLAAVDDPAALAAGIGSLLHDPAHCAAVAAAGRLRYEAEFAEAAVVAQWRRFLASLEKP